MVSHQSLSRDNPNYQNKIYFDTSSSGKAQFISQLVNAAHQIQTFLFLIYLTIAFHQRLSCFELIIFRAVQDVMSPIILVPLLCIPFM